MKISAIRKIAADQLRHAGIEDALREAGYVLALALNIDRAELLNDRELTTPEVECINKLLARRANREPLDRLRGYREFYGYDFGLNAATLSPRADTETLVDMALGFLADHPAPRILDLGTGSGCILLTLLKQLPQAMGVGVDASVAALQQAKANAEILTLKDRATFIESDWFTKVEGVFDLIVSNPPYIPTADIESLEREVRDFDPRAALDGGDDGLDAYRIILSAAKDFLAPGGAVALEVGQGQANDVTRIAVDAGFVCQAVESDLAGIDRALLFTL